MIKIIEPDLREPVSLADLHKCFFYVCREENPYKSLNYPPDFINRTINMQLIKPRQISGDIMTLIEEADEKVILVTPYFKLKNWYKMLNCLAALKDRAIGVEIYVRELEHESIREVEALGFQPITIPNLHAKLYLNEKTAIVSSMNLLYSSDTNSLDIAVKTQNEEEYAELWAYYLRYIKKADRSADQEILPDWRASLKAQLDDASNGGAYLKETPNHLQIHTGNRYEIVIDTAKGNKLVINGILAVKQFKYAVSNLGAIKLKRSVLSYVDGGEGSYDTVCGTIEGLKSTSITEPDPFETKRIVEAIVEFIVAVEKFKRTPWGIR